MPTKKKPMKVKGHRQSRRESASYKGYSLTSTLLNQPDKGAVLVPWLVVQTDPSGVSKVFQKRHGEITYDDWVNVFMAAPGLQKSPFGTLNEFSQTWIAKVSSPRDLSDMIYRLTTYPTVVSATFRTCSLLKTPVDTPMVVILQPDARCVEAMVAKLQTISQDGKSLQKFYFEVDLGPSLKAWSCKVLKEEFTVRGGRFAVVHGTPYNHVFDWRNVFCCIPCVPCCLVASPLYRSQRKLRYKQCILEVDEPMVFVGAETSHPIDQARALTSLMSWARAVGASLACGRCGLQSQGRKGRRCTCDRHLVANPRILIQADTPTVRRHSQTHSLNQVENKMQTLGDIQRFNALSRYESEQHFCTGDSPSSAGNIRSDELHSNCLTGQQSVTPSDIRTLVEIKSRGSDSSSRSSGHGSNGSFSIGELRAFSIAAHKRIHPADDTHSD